MIVAHENNQASLVFQRTHYKNKKKTKEMPESYFYKQRLDIFSALLNRLKTECNIIDAALGKRFDHFVALSIFELLFLIFHFYRNVENARFTKIARRYIGLPSAKYNHREIDYQLNH